MLSPLILGPFLLAALPSSIAAPTLAIQTENPAVIFRTFGGNADVHACLRGENPTYTGIPDGGCYNLPGNYMEVRQIADTCRVFVYENEYCGGAGRQVHTEIYCVPAKNLKTIKAFCH